jgi:RND family efflux transporter MFP subunit
MGYLLWIGNIVFCLIRFAWTPYYFGYYSSEAYASEKEILVRTVPLQEYEMFEQMILPGLCKSTMSREYKSALDGNVDFVSSKEGGVVQKGELILAIDRESSEADLKRAEASYESAKNTYERDKKLFAQKLVSDAVLDESKATYAEAKHQLSKASSFYSKNVIFAPFTGNLSIIKFRVGEPVKSGDYLFTLVSEDCREIRSEVPESLYKYINLVSEVPITDSEGKEFKAKIQAISPILSKKGTIGINLVLEPGSAQLLHDSYVKAAIQYDKRKALALPEICVMRNERGNFIYKIVTEDSITSVKQIYVKTGIRMNNMIEILSEDVKLGDQVVLSGLTKIQNGSIVSISQYESKVN